MWEKDRDSFLGKHEVHKKGNRTIEYYNSAINNTHSSVQFNRSVMSDSATPWTAARQASLSITNSQSLLKLMSIRFAMPSSHLILCRSLLLPPSINPSISVFSNESALRIRWPKYYILTSHNTVNAAYGVKAFDTNCLGASLVAQR